MKRNKNYPSEFLRELITNVGSTGCNHALIDIINIIELNVQFKNFSIEEKNERFGSLSSYSQEKIEIILTKEEIKDLGKYFLCWAGLPDKVSRDQILWGLRHFSGEVGAPVILEIIQKYGNELTYQRPMFNEIIAVLMSLSDSFFWHRDFDDAKAVEFLTKMNPTPFLEKYIDFPDDDIASYANDLLQDFTKILSGYIYENETGQLYPP